jgi:hypothetical protein
MISRKVAGKIGLFFGPILFVLFIIIPSRTRKRFTYTILEIFNTDLKYFVAAFMLVTWIDIVMTGLEVRPLH